MAGGLLPVSPTHSTGAYVGAMCFTTAFNDSASEGANLLWNLAWVGLLLIHSTMNLSCFYIHDNSLPNPVICSFDSQSGSVLASVCIVHWMVYLLWHVWFCAAILDRQSIGMMIRDVSSCVQSSHLGTVAETRCCHCTTNVYQCDVCWNTCSYHFHGIWCIHESMPGYRIAHCFSLSSTLFNYIFTALKAVTCLDEKVSIYSETFCIGVECRLVTFGVVVAMVTGGNFWTTGQRWACCKITACLTLYIALVNGA